MQSVCSKKMDRSSAEPTPSQPSSPNPYTSTPSKLKNAATEGSQGQVLQIIDRVHSNETLHQLDYQGPGNGDSSPCSPGTVSSPAFMVARKESYKLQRKNYRFEKKKAANELLCSFKDPAVVVLADWLKGIYSCGFRDSCTCIDNKFVLCSSGDAEELDKAVVYTETRCHFAL